MARLGKFRLSWAATVLMVAVGAVCAAWLAAAVDAGPAGRFFRGGVAGLGSALCHTRGDAWVGPFLRSRLTILFGGLVLASAATLYLLAGVLWRLGQGQRTVRRTGQSGTAAIEFVLVFPLALTIILVMLQSALLVTGNLDVHYAAYAAARAAIVWVPEKVSYDEPRNVVGDPASSFKMERITSAAVYAVMPVSAGKAGAGGAGGAGDAGVVQDGLDRFHQLYAVPTPAWVRTMLASKYEYARSYTEVTLDPPVSGTAYTDGEDLRAHVRHNLYLSIPYVNRIFGRALAGGDGDYGVEVFASYALGNQGVEDEIDIEQFPRTVGRGGP